ncbi:MAG: DUF5689 domain-containing protein [Chitinophagales bacterium]
MRYFLLLSGVIFFMSGCIHDNFDEPPANGEDPDIDPNVVISIADLKNLYNGADAVELTDSVYISGVVVADDKSGNFYQTIVIEDETAGISIRLSVSDFYNTYPIGRRLFVLVQGLYIGQYNNLVQLGTIDPEESDGVERIPNFLVENYFFPGKFGVHREPTVVTYSELNASPAQYQNRLLKLENVEFAAYELGQTLADADNQQTENRDLVDCEDNSIIVRTSGFAEFAKDTLPTGNGDLTFIFTVFGTTKQLILRDLSDINFTGLRCAEEPCVDTQTPVDGVSEDFESAELFDPISINNWKTLSVIGNGPWVARDFDNNQYALVQGFGSGSAIESWLVSPKVNFAEVEGFSFKSKIGYWKHDGLKVFISTDFDGCNVTAATWTELTSAVIANTSNSPDGVSGYASNFINSGNVDLTGYTSIGYIGFQYIGDDQNLTTTYQVDDVQIGDAIIIQPPTCDPATSIDEDFESLSAFDEVDVECWQNIATVGAEKWEGRSFSSNTYPQITGHNSTSASIETYLISPAFDLSAASTLSFDSKIGFCNHEGLKVYISTDYDGGGAPLTATWTELTATIASSSNSSCASGYAANFIASGDVDLSSFSGTGYIAFVYTGNNSTQTTTYQVDNVVIN